MPRERLTMNADYEPWDRQPGESAKHYGRFGYYRDMGPTRTVNRLHKMLNELGDKIKPDSLRQAAWYHRWADRAQAWDISQQEADRERLALDRREMIRRHRTVATALMTKAINALKTLKPEELTPRDIAVWLKLATDIERVALGEPQHTVAVSGPAGGPIQTEDISGMDPEQRRRRLAEIAAELARRAGTDVDDDD